MNKTLKQLSLALACLAGAVAAPHAVAQAYPAKPITVYVPFAPGTITDLVFRSVGNAMSKSLNTPIIIDNKIGANGIIAWEYVVRRQPADGYSIAASTNSTLSLPVFTKDLPIDPVKELSPVAIVAESALLLHSPVAAPWNSMAEMVAYARANPGKLNWGSSGSTSIATLNAHAIMQRDGLDIVTIPFQGGNNQAILALLSNDVQLLFSTTAEGTVNTQAKKTKGLGLTGEQRLAVFPGVPTLAELGYPLQMGVWWALNVRPGTSKAIIDRLYAAARVAVQQQEVKDFFGKSGISAAEVPPETVAKRYDEIFRQYQETAAKAGLKPQ
ncbi:MAG: tripartite tricarboxylate transporter substrate binding protein [Betaproteobacteria bacterium]|nr:tripartite tricarboxylate transporter substrate binding protein [Betaproteobacteria bacterium]